MVFAVKAPEAGTYQLSTYAVPSEDLKKDDQGNVIALYVKIQIGNERPTKRILYDLHQASNQVSGKFELNGKDQQVKLWLPKGVQLGYIEWKNYNAPEVPLAARNYVPKIVPPSGHPRLWVTPQTLPMVKARLTEGENQPIWAAVSASAKAPYRFDFDANKEVFIRKNWRRLLRPKPFII